MSRLLSSQDGVTLMELIVSVGLFAAVLVMATGIFQSVVSGQQAAIASQNTQESLRYALEVMSKEIRNAKTSNTATAKECQLSGATEPGKRIFNTDTVSVSEFDFDVKYLYFKNKNNECVYYFKKGNALMVYRKNVVSGENYLASTTPNSIIVSGFDFYIYDRLITDYGVNSKQAYVTFFIKAYSKGRENLKNETVLQTSISSRMYE